ncbi:KR domain-containing protein, partial [Bradyrhizobium sp. WBAH10]
AVAIRLVGGAGHTGKVVLDVPRTGEGVAVVPPEQVRTSRPDGAYLVTGGLGGLGLFLAGELAAAGCGRIVLNSRSTPSPHATRVIERLRAAACSTPRTGKPEAVATATTRWAVAASAMSPHSTWISA